MDYGCGVACFAFACNMTFKQAVEFLGQEYSTKHGWRPSDLVAALNRCGFSYKNHYVRKKPNRVYPSGTIVLLERSTNYPVGHYLVQHHNVWMDPWINLPEGKDITKAQSGYRKRLPGQPMYALLPLTNNS